MGKMCRLIWSSFVRDMKYKKKKKRKIPGVLGGGGEGRRVESLRWRRAKSRDASSILAQSTNG